jgi:lipid II:glycine glycyltransferase (peptidoglycan interpeptide bridge formation enzyme)
LVPQNKLLPLYIRRQGEIIATGLFPYDESCIYFWGGASWIKDRKWYPNELLHWKVMEFAVSRGIRAYNMCGGTSQFKNKFGGADVPYLTFSKSALPFLQMARNAYRAYHFHRLHRAGRNPIEVGGK